MPLSRQDLSHRYGEPLTPATAKVFAHLDHHCRRFIEASPFVVIATHDGDGHMDASPRGGAPGFVEIIDEHTLHLPDRPGNARVDSMNNICAEGDIGLLFFIPGIHRTLRINGQARILTDESLLAHYQVGDHAALSVLEVSVAEVFFHGGKALVRARLWDSDLQTDSAGFPSLGEVLVDQIDGLDEEEAQSLLKESEYSNLY